MTQCRDGRVAAANGRPTSDREHLFHNGKPCPDGSHQAITLPVEGEGESEFVLDESRVVSTPMLSTAQCFLVTPEFFRMSRVRCFSPLPRCLYRPRYLYPRTSSGPMLIVGDNPVSGSLVSQSKCHSGELTFSRWRKPMQPAPVCGCHPCGSKHERTIPFVSDRPFFFSHHRNPLPCPPPRFYS